MKKYLLFILPVLLLIACKQEPKETVSTENQTAEETMVEDNMNSSFPDNPIKLQDPCTLLEIKDIESIFNVPGTIVDIKSGMVNKSKGQDHNVSCFYTWENNQVNGGFLLQLMKNPLYGEFDNWASSYLEVLVTNGETSYPEGVQYKYTKIDGLSDGAVYNDQLGKLYWRKGEEMVVGIIFRDTSSFSSLENIGKKIAKVLNPRIEIKQ